MCFLEAASNAWCCAVKTADAMQASASPKLWDSTSPRLCLITNCCADKMSASWSLLASTRSMVEAGAMACAHWTSREISEAQSTSSALVGSNGVSPSGAMMLSLGFGSPNVESNSARSLAMVGLWKASTMAMVLRAPVSLLGTSYAARIWVGVKHGIGLAADSGAWHENVPEAFGP